MDRRDVIRRRNLTEQETLKKLACDSAAIRRV